MNKGAALAGEETGAGARRGEEPGGARHVCKADGLRRGAGEAALRLGDLP